MAAARSRWTILHSDYAIDTPHLRLRRDRIRLPSGFVIEDYFVRESRGFAVVFALTADDMVVLVRQYKHGIGEEVLELPAGAIDEGETAEACARRELREETGYEVEDLSHAATFATDPTNSNSHLYLFSGSGARLVAAPEPEPTEEIAVELVPLDDLRGYVTGGSIDVSSHVAAIYYMLDKIGRLGGSETPPRGSQ